MKKLAIGTLLAVSTVLATVGSVNAAQGDGAQRSAQMQKHQQKESMNIDKGPLSKLNLTASQKSQIKAIMATKKAERDTNREQTRANREQMRTQVQALSNASTLNTATLNRLADQHAAQEKQRFIEKVQDQQAIAKILTAEQRSQLQQMKTERAEKGDSRGQGDKDKGRNRS